MRIKPAVVTVGDELVFGERPNQNQTWLLQELWRRSRPAQIAMSLPDAVETIAEWLRRLLATEHYPILVCGGIGGTHDDRTREGAAKALGVPLSKHELCHELLQAKYGDRFTPERQRMAWLPEGCELIANPIGAPGFQLGGVFAFPGFPEMLRPMALDVLVKILPLPESGTWISREYVLPVAEGEIAGAIEAFAANSPAARIGIYPSAGKSPPEVTVRLRCPQHSAQTLGDFEQLIDALRKAVRAQRAH